MARDGETCWSESVEDAVMDRIIMDHMKQLIESFGDVIETYRNRTKEV